MEGNKMADLFTKLKANIIGKNLRIVFPEPNDVRVLDAVKRLADEGLIVPVIIGDKPEYNQIDGVEVFHYSTYPEMDSMVDALVEVRKGKLKRDRAIELLQNPNYFGTMLVYLGVADGLVSGATHSTADTIRPALQIIKTKPHITKTFGYFLMLKGDTTYIMGDCAINPNPVAKELAEFAVESGRIAESFGLNPRVAMLSFSTAGSATTPETEKVINATMYAKKMDPDLKIDGEMQFDAAIVPRVGQFKFPGSRVAGKANVFIFPDLNSGNIGYKIAQRMGDYEAVGPILAGLNAPVNDLSRGCNEEDVYKTAIVTAAQAIK